MIRIYETTTCTETGVSNEQKEATLETIDRTSLLACSQLTTTTTRKISVHYVLYGRLVLMTFND